MHAGRLVYIVDDSAEDRAVIRRYLSQDRAHLYRFAEFDGFEATIAGCREHRPDCLILDFDLGEDDGLELLERLCTEFGRPPFPIIMLTGRGSEAVAVQALKRGALDYVVKDQYTPDSLQQTVSEAVAKFAARPSLERQRAELERSYFTSGDVAAGRERLVLIVDDSVEDRTVSRRALMSGSGGPKYRFLEEETGAEGLALCRSAGLDCLLLDYSLPDMNGLEFLHELTGGTGVTPFPVVMLTGRGDEAICVQALKRGAMDYLVKGRFTPEGLRSTVEQAVERLAARRVQEEQRVRLLERLEAESRRRADALAQSDRRKDEFLAMLAHELRNPLAPIANAVQLLRITVPESGAALDIAERQIKHLARLVDDLMDVSRVTRGKILLRKELVDLNAVVQRSIESSRPLIAAQNHRLATTLPATPARVWADPTRLEQIFTNLLHNAAKYTDPGGRIDVTLDLEPNASEPTAATVRIRDTGIGIDRDVLPWVFDLFAQADRSLDRAQGGLGIGLTLVRALTEQHGGSVAAQSEGRGKGSEFSVRLPLADPSDLERPTEARTAGPPPTALRVLLVDDNMDGVDTLAMLFRAWGHEVITSYDGAAGLAACKTHRPDVAFLDIGLPRMNGYDLAQAIHAELKDQAPLLAAVTGYGQSDDRRRAEAAGFRYHLVKPVSPDDLLLVLREAATRLRRDGRSANGDGRAAPAGRPTSDGRGRHDGRATASSDGRGAGPASDGR